MTRSEILSLHGVVDDAVTQLFEFAKPFHLDRYDAEAVRHELY